MKNYGRTYSYAVNIPYEDWKQQEQAAAQMSFDFLLRQGHVSLLAARDMVRDDIMSEAYTRIQPYRENWNMVLNNNVDC